MVWFGDRGKLGVRAQARPSLGAREGRARVLSVLVVVGLLVGSGGAARAAISVGATGTATGSATLLVTTATPSWSVKQADRQR